MVHAAYAMPTSTTLPRISHILGTLLDRGVGVNAKDATGSTALHLLYELCYRYQRCVTKTFNLLLRRGSDRFVANNNGENVLELIKKDDK
jgi:ankyrin repeat protein